MSSVSSPAFLALCLCLVVFGVTLLLFGPTVEAGFVNWDDDRMLLENPHYRGFDAASLRWMLTTFHQGHYHPLTWLSFAADHALWGMDPAGYHLTNVLLHGTNAALVVVLLLLLLRRCRPRAPEPARLLASGVGALLFAVHPLRVESVAWVTERRDVLSGLFLLLAVILYLRGLPSAAGSARRGWGLIVSAYSLSLLSKAWGITLPVVLLALDGLLRRADPALPLRARWAPLLREKIPLFALALVFAGLSAAAQGEHAMVAAEDHPPGTRILQAGYGIGFYLVKSVVPTSLSPLYPLNPAVIRTEWIFGLALMAAVGGTLLLFALRWRWRAGWATWLCYAAVLSPVLGLTQSGPQLVADRYSYLAMIPWVALISGGLLLLLHAEFAERARSLLAIRGVAVGLAALALVGLARATAKQRPVWNDSVSLWYQALRVDPDNILALRNIGIALHESGRVLEARAAWRECSRLSPDYAPAYFLLGRSEQLGGNAETAMAWFRRTLAADPSHDLARRSLLEAEREARGDGSL